MHSFLKFILGMKLYMFRTVPLSIIRSFPLYTQQWYMSYRLCWHIPLLCVQWKSPDDVQRNCLKHVEFHSKNKFEESVHLVGFIIGNLSRCTVTWTSNLNDMRLWVFYFKARGQSVYVWCYRSLLIYSYMHCKLIFCRTF